MKDLTLKFEIPLKQIKAIVEEVVNNAFEAQNEKQKSVINLGEQDKEYLTKKEAAKLLSCSVSTIDNYRRAGILKRYNIGSSVRFKKVDVLATMEQVNTNEKSR